MFFDRSENLVERGAGLDDDGLHTRDGGHVEKRCAGVRWHTGGQHRQPRIRHRWAAPFIAGLHAPREARGGDEELPIPDIHSAHTAGATGTEHLLVVTRVGEPGLFVQNPFCGFTIEVGRRDDRIPSALRLGLRQHRNGRQISRRRLLEVETAQPVGVERRTLAGVGKQ